MRVEDLIEGHVDFKDKKFKKYESKFLDLVENGQNPKALFIACSDSRIDPALITSSKPGTLFILRNIGNFVPPFSPDNDYHATAAGIEYATSVLGITDIIVCGHSHCGAISSLYNDISSSNLVHVKKWLDLGVDAKKHVEKYIKKDASIEEKLMRTEQISVLFQMENLLSYPEVQEKVNEGKLSIRGWYYRIETGELEYYCDEEGSFLPMS